MTFIPKSHILSKKVFLNIFCTFRPFWRTSLLKWKKVNKMKKVRLVDTSLECGLRFFIFSRPKKCARFHVLCVHTGTCTGPNNLKQLRRPNFSSGEGLVNFRIDLAEKRDGQIWTKRDGQSINQADNQSSGQPTAKFI